MKLGRSVRNSVEHSPRPLAAWREGELSDKD